MKERDFNKVIRDLKKLFSDNEKALGAIEYLSSSVSSDNFQSSSANAEGAGELPLPEELSGVDIGFALFSDGACRGNPGPGAWGQLVQNSQGEVLFVGSGVETLTTNNKMELQGAIESLKQLVNYLKENVPPKKPIVFLYSDSKYVVDGITKWVPGWKSKGWKKADKKTPENVELWKELDQLSSLFSNLKFKWVKGHSGHPQNEECDRLANEALDNSGF